MEKLNSLDILLCIAEHLEQADQAVFCLLNRDISLPAHRILYRHLRIRTGADLGEIEHSIALFELFDTRPDASFVTYAVTCTQTIEFLPSRLTSPKGKLWPNMALQHKFVETVSSHISKFPKLVNLHWHLPLGYCLGPDREGKDAIIRLWKQLALMVQLRRIYILEYYPHDFRSWGGHIRHFECLRTFAVSRELYESQQVGKKRPRYEKVSNDWILRMQLGPYDVTSDTLQESHYLDLFSWDLHGFQPRQGFTAQAHYFLELMMPRDCELY